MSPFVYAFRRPMSAGRDEHGELADKHLLSNALSNTHCPVPAGRAILKFSAPSPHSSFPCSFSDIAVSPADTDEQPTINFLIDKPGLATV